MKENVKKTKLLSRHRLIAKSVFIIVLIALVGISITLLVGSKQEKTTSDPTSITEVKISKDGFEPSSISVKKGTVIIWTNIDEAPHQVASNPYPGNQDLPRLKSEILNNQQTYQFKTDEIGNFGYHDQIKPTTNGNIEVKE